MSSAHSAADNRVHFREAVSLAEAGYRVTLVAVAPPEGIALEDTPVTIVTVPRRSRLSRMILGTTTVLVTALKTRAHVYHLHDPELVWTIPFLKVAGARVVYDAHEDLPDQVLGKPYIPVYLRGLVSWFARAIVAASGRADHTVAATDRIARRYSKSSTTVVRNFPRVTGHKAPPDLDDRLDQAVYVGGMTVERGIPQVIAAGSHSEFPKGWRIVLAGSADAGTRDLVRGHQGAVVAMGQVAPIVARETIAKSKAGLVTFLASPAHMDALPTKMFEYFAEGTPVIASDFPLWRSIIEHYDCGILVDPESPSSIAKAIAKYASDRELWRRHSRNAWIAASEHLNWETESEALLSAYQRILGYRNADMADRSEVSDPITSDGGPGEEKR